MLNNKSVTILFFISLLLPAFAVAQPDSVASGVYTWQSLQVNNKLNPSNILFEGSTHDFEWMQMSAATITDDKTTLIGRVPANEERLLIVKSGTVNISFGDSSYLIGPGSIALLISGEKYSLTNNKTVPVVYYLMKYRSKLPMDIARGKNAGGSFVKDFSKISFNPHERGGIRNYFERATAMGKRLEMHVTTLNGSIKSHEPHTHRAEELVIMIEGNTEMQIGDKFYKGTAGDIYYLGSNVLHAIRNTDKKSCVYFAFQFE